MTTLTAADTPSDQRPLTGRVAVITGASSGMGAATAESLAAAGAKVALLARRKDRLDALVERLAPTGAEVVAHQLDVTDQDAADAVAARVREQLGRVDLVFNNAGVMLPGPITQQPRDEWQHQIDLNVTGLMHTIGAFVPQLVEAGQAGGTADLINTSSIAAQNIFPGFAVYSATKAFVTHLSRTLRAELGAQGVRVSTIEPGITETELQGHVTDEASKAWLADAAQTMELLQPQDIASVVTYLAGLPRRVNLQQVTVMPTQEQM
ncbi:SDR family oxidoreductase [Conexibacter sp. SYSU D00693]|uniref:SDR family oxidoreductase n=1 Tax=Conexibacter sp. SYSU D00693 TaxID=2812560 RepID=UPI00196ABEB6|nr:SDR family oxidoreductase [Conexibacter sp. SYSU D00693]